MSVIYIRNQRNLNQKMAVLWVVPPCSLIKIYQRFEGSCCPHHQGSDRRENIENLRKYFQKNRTFSVKINVAVSISRQSFVIFSPVAASRMSQATMKPYDGVPGGARPHVRLGARVRCRSADPRAKPHSSSFQRELRWRATLGRRSESHQLHQLGKNRKW